MEISLELTKLIDVNGLIVFSFSFAEAASFRTAENNIEFRFAIRKWFRDKSKESHRLKDRPLKGLALLKQ